MVTPVASDAESFADGDHQGYGAGYVSHRFPVHDACEFLDAESLRRLVFVRESDSSDDDSDSSDDDSSSDGSESSGTDGEHDNADCAAAVTGLPQTESSTPQADTKISRSSDQDVPMDVDDESKLANGTPKKDNTANNVDDLVEDISPVKLNSTNTEVDTSNAELLAEKLTTPENNAKDDNTTSKKNKKKKSKEKTVKEKEPKYYCPHNLDMRDMDENTPLHIAILNRKLEHMQILLEAGASCHRKCDGSPPIHTVISVGAITAHKGFAYDASVLLQKHGVDFNARDEALHTPLYLSAVCNLPSVAGLILSDPEGMQTINCKSDRSGGRPLHAAAKFDMPKVKLPTNPVTGNGVSSESIAAVTQLLLNTSGVDVDAKNNYGKTPLHIAAGVGNWQVVRLLLKSGADPSLTDQQGYTPGGLAYKRGMPVPSDLSSSLGQIDSGMPPFATLPSKRDLIIDPMQSTFLICHELCSNHFTCPPIVRDPDLDVPPENIRRLSVLLDQNIGILRGAEFDGCRWEAEARRASLADILKIHEYSYIENINRLCNQIPDNPQAIAHLDGDTAISRWSFEAALRAAGSVCDAVDRLMAGDFRNAFCAVRPPGHHAGPRGIVRCANDAEGSHGFCLLNNVAIGAAYARSMYRNDGIKKVAIVDFDVHHGNGTEEIIRQLSPNVEKTNIRMSFASGTFETPKYKPWLDETDIDNVFFASAHGYGPRCLPEVDDLEPLVGGWFYPASGKSYISESFRRNIETPDQNEFLLSQTWTRMGEEMRMNCCKIINVGLSLPRPGDIPGMQRVDVRDAYRKQILPNLLQFDPDIIFVSAGFDGHKKDTMNHGYVGMVEEDYEWVTEQLVKVANTCCNGRIVSVLEGGYKIHGGIVSPFARSVASHVRALIEGGNSRELYDNVEADWESKFERHMIEERERRKQLRIERLSRSYAGESSTDNRRRSYSSFNSPNPASYDMDAMMTEPLSQGDVLHEANGEDLDDDQQRKRRRNAGNVNYKELYEQLRKEGVA